MRIYVYYEPIVTKSEMPRYKMGCRRRRTKENVCLLLNRNCQEVILRRLAVVNVLGRLFVLLVDMCVGGGG